MISSCHGQQAVWSVPSNHRRCGPGTLDPPEAPPKIFRRMSPNDIASRFFTSWYTIYERVSSCQATAVGATTEFEIRLQTKAVGIGSRLIQRGGFPILLRRFVEPDPASPRRREVTRSVALRFNSPDADCLHIIYLWRAMGSVELRIASHAMFSEVWRSLTNASGV
jgi:hypothetical protein